MSRRFLASLWSVVPPSRFFILMSDEFNCGLYLGDLSFSDCRARILEVSFRSASNPRGGSRTLDEPCFFLFLPGFALGLGEGWGRCGRGQAEVPTETFDLLLRQILSGKTRTQVSRQALTPMFLVLFDSQPGAHWQGAMSLFGEMKAPTHWQGHVWHVCCAAYPLSR